MAAQRGGRTEQISRHYLALRRMLWRHFSAEEPWVLEWVRIHRIRVDGRIRFEYATCGRGNFWFQKEKLRIEKYPDTCGNLLRSPDTCFQVNHLNGLLFGERLYRLFTSSDSEISGFTRPHVIGFVAVIFFSTLESEFFFRIRCWIFRMRVDGSRIWKEKVADSKISGYVWTGLTSGASCWNRGLGR